jgi:hypothetical protein
VQAILIRDSAFQRIADAGGPMTTNERSRRCFTVWQAASDRAERLLKLVGLQRQPRQADVPLSPGGNVGAELRRLLEEESTRA